MKTIIHVNQHKIRANRKRLQDPFYARAHGKELEPVLTVKTYRSNDYARQATIFGQDGKPAATIVYSPNKPLSCGAHVWIETEQRVELSGGTE